jgi:signal transduction histidine kinase
VKFSKPDTPLLIEISGSVEKGSNLGNHNLDPGSQYYHINISDNGIGFEEQYSEKIFKVFQRLHAKNEYDGTGIGLSIVKKIVENHHGIITAHGEPGKGARFEIYIPA